jgi:U3 small nucleolar RNA-associated protein 10
VAALLGFVERVTIALGTTLDSAIICIDKISKRFGKKDPSKILPAARVLVGDHGIGSNSPRIRITSLLTLASMVDILREDMLEYIPTTLQRCYHLLAANIGSQTRDTTLHRASFALINSITEHLPFILSGDLLDNAFRLAQMSTAVELDESDDSRDQFYRTVARKIGASEVFSLLQRNYSWAKMQSHSAMLDYYNLAKYVVELHSKKEVLKNSNTLFQFIGEAFELRSFSVASDKEIRIAPQEAENLEIMAIDIALAAVLKINDATFRPFFIQLVEWASWKSTGTSRSSMSKAITLFQFLKALLAHLKVGTKLEFVQ